MLQLHELCPEERRSGSVAASVREIIPFNVRHLSVNYTSKFDMHLRSVLPIGEHLDLLLSFAVVVITDAVVLLEAPVPFRTPLVILTLFLIPGYVLTAALFPAGEPTALSNGVQPPDSSQRSISPLERTVLSVGISIAIFPIVGICIDTFVGQLSTASLLVSMNLVIIFSVIVATIHRQYVPLSVRYAPGVLLEGIPSKRIKVDALTVILALSIVFAGGAIGYSQFADSQSTGLTELYVLNKSSADGGTATDFRTELAQGTSTSFSVVIGNAEGNDIDYTIVVQLQHVKRTGHETIVQERRQVSQHRVMVPSGDTRELNETITPSTPGNKRVVYLLYRGDAPENPQIQNAYREVHLWLEVNESTSSAEN